MEYLKYLQLAKFGREGLGRVVRRRLLEAPVGRQRRRLVLRRKEYAYSVPQLVALFRVAFVQLEV